jgi:hypothetical protein
MLHGQPAREIVAHFITAGGQHGYRIMADRAKIRTAPPFAPNPSWPAQTRRGPSRTPLRATGADAFCDLRRESRRPASFRARPPRSTQPPKDEAARSPSIRPQLRLNNSRGTLPLVSAIAIASQRRGEEANDDGDDDGRVSESYFTAWQDRNTTAGAAPAKIVAGENSHQIDRRTCT